MKKIKALCFVMAILVVASLASAAFAEDIKVEWQATSPFLLVTDSGLGGVTVSDDDKLYSKDVEKVTEIDGATVFSTSGDFVYILKDKDNIFSLTAADGKVIPNKYEGGLAASGDQITAFAFSGDNGLAAVTAKGLSFSSGDTTGVVSSEDVAGLIDIAILANSIKDGVVVTATSDKLYGFIADGTAGSGDKVFSADSRMTEVATLGGSGIVGITRLGDTVYVALNNAVKSVDLTADKLDSQDVISDDGRNLEISAITVSDTKLYALGNNKIYTWDGSKSESFDLLQASGSTQQQNNPNGNGETEEGKDGGGGSGAAGVSVQTAADDLLSSAIAVSGDTVAVVTNGTLKIYVKSKDATPVVYEEVTGVSVAKVKAIVAMDIPGLSFDTTVQNEGGKKDDDPDQGSSETVDFSSLSKDVQDAITVRLGVPQAQILTSADVKSVDVDALPEGSSDLKTNLTSTDSLISVIERNSDVKLAKAQSYGLLRLSKRGYVIQKVERPTDISTLKNFVFYFIKASFLNRKADGSSASAFLAEDNGNIVNANLVDSKGNVLESDSDGNIPDEFYAVPSRALEATDYAMVAGTEETPTDASSSGGGCELGLGLWSLAALMAFATLGKRR